MNLSLGLPIPVSVRPSLQPSTSSLSRSFPSSWLNPKGFMSGAESFLRLDDESFCIMIPYGLKLEAGSDGNVIITLFTTLTMM